MRVTTVGDKNLWKFIKYVQDNFSDEVAEFVMSGYTSMPWRLYRFTLGYYLVNQLLPDNVEVEDAWLWINKEFRKFVDSGVFV